MHVPDHIYVDGSNGYRRRSKSHSSNQAEILTVPERITLGGGGTHVGAKADPGKDLIRNRIDAISVQESGDVPSVITASQLPNHDSHSGPNMDNVSHSSSIDENPIKEMKLIKRRIGNMSTRIMDLEEENARRQTRELGLWAVLSAAVVALASLFLKKR